jgi:hypothetical protein
MGPQSPPGSPTEEKAFFPLPEFEPRTILLPYLNKEYGSQGSEMADSGSESR